MVTPQNKKIILFDLCETLVDFQTADKFVEYSTEKKNSKWLTILSRLCLSFKIDRMINKFMLGESVNKRIILFQLRGRVYKELDLIAKEYVENVMLKRLNSKIIDIMRNHISNGDRVILISGGYDLYIKHFSSALGIKEFICTNIAFNDKGKCLGYFSDKNCMGENKVRLLKAFVQEDLSSYDIVTYSDSITDLPLFKISQKGVVVSKACSSTWAKKYNLAEIVL
ncbi:TPA: HAD-IB family hydrolase [Vibrio parahaemolyticus]|uniref:HAD family hydrolase n=1 Tax=Vibrio parahaemolyticus TaxID=670 RepID=UPI001A31E20C|nr:HAD family hydrolase [Vibrio parahaemolyticus]EHZ2905747.1 haloacid dehalogenase-like hydrolase [Vibrio parahaemolyticus]EJG1574966.1 haloacid dehalogenase-like hydrolase [Vibrio parahaemolyticus]MBE4101476.1 haloacid dehalogenase-like hydrolase [Vibrio parahaemolyticus]MDF4983626.1 HAD family hydrolase [Vibrio parahaemolyticus]MDT8846730.1 haloacid dehalogenase-like hydrolase [Vibrio parahaemolyticus]